MDVYRRDGVEPALLDLQNSHGLNVNLLLWCVWCAEGFGELDALIIRNAVERSRIWSQSVAEPLRAARRGSKSASPASDEERTNSLRAKIKEAELAAEQMEQDWLQSLAAAHLKDAEPGAPCADLARRNLAAYVRQTQAVRSPGFSVSLLENLIALTIGRPESSR